MGLQLGRLHLPPGGSLTTTVAGTKLDLAVAGRPAVVGWRKRIWFCADDDCEVGSWTERRDDVAEPRA